VVAGDAEYESLREMVDAYVTAVRAAHPGPYRLLGFSLGGYLAGRVAEVLESLGATVEFVGVLDWDAQQKITPAAQREGLVRLSVASYLFLQQEMGILQPRAEACLRDEIGALVDQIAVGASGGGEAFFRWVVENQLTTSAALEDLARQYLVRFEQHCRLLTHELPQAGFSAPLIVWRARDGFGSGIESWGRSSALDREHAFEGDHNALMRPDALERVGAQLVDFMHTLGGARPVENAGAAQLA
jgi:thioesterase domain-containing protein